MSQTFKTSNVIDAAHDSETEATHATAETATRSAAANRMRRHRQRQRNGLRCFTVELRQTEIEVLVHRGYLKNETRNDERSIIDALYAHLEDTLV